MQTYRLFIAIEISPAARAELAAVQQRLQRADVPAKWAATDTLHLTLHFLGETDTAIVARLKPALQAAVAEYPQIGLCLDGIGAFPNARRPGVVWAGVGGDLSALGRLQSALGAALEALGLPREQRPFRPHLTLGRVRREAGPAQIERLGEAILAQAPPAPLAWQIERVVLFRSQLEPAGPVYTAVYDWRLAIGD